MASETTRESELAVVAVVDDKLIQGFVRKGILAGARQVFRAALANSKGTRNTVGALFPVIDADANSEIATIMDRQLRGRLCEETAETTSCRTTFR